MHSASLVIIGNEILSGRTQDIHVNYIAKELGNLGIRFAEARIIPDNEEEIIKAVNGLRKKYRYLFTTGGIGPTHDDITSESIAKAFNVALIEHPKALELLTRHYAGTGQELNAARRKMAFVPEGSVLIPNPISAAPGFVLENVYVFAGVPAIMRAMFDSIRHELLTGKPIGSCTVITNLAEGTVAAALSAVQARFPTVEIGSYPYVRSGNLGTSLVARSDDETLLEVVRKAITSDILALGGKLLTEEEFDAIMASGAIL